MNRSNLGMRMEKGLMDAIRSLKNGEPLKTTVLEKITIIKLLQRHGLTVSFSEGRRVVAQGAVKLNGELITDMQTEVIVRTGDVLEVGKRKVVL